MTTPTVLTNEPPALPSEDDMMAFVHERRMYVLDAMLAKGMPEDPADRKTIVSVLKDMDGQALGRKRIKVEEKQNNNQEQAAALIAQVLNAAAGASPFKVTGHTRAAPTLPAEVPAPVLVVGETSTVAPQQSYESFVVPAP